MILILLIHCDSYSYSFLSLHVIRSQDVSSRFEQRVQSRFSGRILRSWRNANFTKTLQHVYRSCLICLKKTVLALADDETTVEEDELIINPQSEEEKEMMNSLSDISYSSSNTSSTPTSNGNTNTSPTSPSNDHRDY